MEEKTTWQSLIPIDISPNLVEPGIRSREKDVQYAREKVILQALYFSRTMYVDCDSNNVRKNALISCPSMKEHWNLPYHKAFLFAS
jgi:protein phosphatase 1 regulatory subunit 10